MRFEWEGRFDKVWIIKKEEVESLIGKEKTQELIETAKEFGFSVTGPITTPFDSIRCSLMMPEYRSPYDSQKDGICLYCGEKGEYQVYPAHDGWYWLCREHFQGDDHG